MSIPFSRTMGSLSTSTYRASLVTLIIAMVFLTVWAAWFFLAQMTLYETGQLIRTTPVGAIVAEFPLDTLKRIQRGQSAFLFPQDATGDPTGPFPSIVTDIATQKERVRVELYPRKDAAALMALPRRLTGEVKLEVGYTSPAALILHASGQFFDILPVSFSPQQR